MNVLALNNRVRFTLKSKEFDSISIVEPIGWETDDKEFTRNETYHGIFINMSNNLTFVGNGADYIELVYNTEGILSELRLTKEERHPETDHWTLSYAGYLDMSTYTKEDEKVKIKFNSGGIEATLKAHESTMVEIDRADTIDGNSLSKIVTEEVYMDSRGIFLESIWNSYKVDFYKRLHVSSNTTATRNNSNTLSFEIVKKSHEQAQITSSDGLDGDDGIGRNTFMLLLNVDRKRDFTVKLNNIKFDAYSFMDERITVWMKG